ncbi:MAG: hypothetical protein MJ231_07050 [bacterium]|nr:hypothetical protein [bacterium]
MKHLKLLSLIIFCILLTACTKQETELAKMANPWKYCNNDMACAEKVAKIKFPIAIPGLQVRAMDGMIEVLYFLDQSREITIRKAAPSDPPKDISGDYNQYPVIKQITLKNGVPIQIRGTENKIYVMNFYNSKGNYAVMCEKGMSFDEALNIYIVISQVEFPNFNPSDIR